MVFFSCITRTIHCGTSPCAFSVAPTLNNADEGRSNIFVTVWFYTSRTEGDVKAYARKRCKPQQQNLKRQDLLPFIIEWFEFSAWLPDDIEFGAFWQHILERRGCMYVYVL